MMPEQDEKQVWISFTEGEMAALSLSLVLAIRMGNDGVYVRADPEDKREIYLRDVLEKVDATYEKFQETSE